MTEVVKMSQKMYEPKSTGRPQKYPWEQLEVGSSFHVPRDGAKLTSLKAYAASMGVKLGKVFRVVDHGEGKDYEVGCIKERAALKLPSEFVPLPVNELSVGNSEAPPTTKE